MDHKEDRAPKNGCFQIAELEKALESPLDCKEIKPIILREILNENSLETPTLWPPEVKGRLNRKRHRCWERLKAEENGAAEDEMVRQHHCLNGHEFEQNSRKQ